MGDFEIGALDLNEVDPARVPAWEARALIAEVRALRARVAELEKAGNELYDCLDSENWAAYRHELQAWSAIRSKPATEAPPTICGADLVWMRPGNRPGGIVPCNRPPGHAGPHQALVNEPKPATEGDGRP